MYPFLFTAAYKILRVYFFDNIYFCDLDLVYYHSYIFAEPLYSHSIFQYVLGGSEMKIQPIGDRVLVKLETAEEKTAGGIFIPQTAQEKTQIGKVVAVGDDKDAIKVKVGQKVMYDKYAGTNIKADGEDQLILRMSDILAVIG